ncbi:MAG: CRISPR-associated endonuclease Cas6 [Proteobacteria bacterium]|nr:CRISPR-associated endonuclease Cas6 [Pseudomonadota bacterium]
MPALHDVRFFIVNSLGLTPIYNLKEVKTSLKSTPMLGFLGNFSVNFEIPDYWGIGKSVARGYGTVKRVISEQGIVDIDE